jgi:acetamidase/formamidase
MMKRLLSPCLIVTAPWGLAANFELKASPGTVVWGYYSASAKPALRIHSGDTVRMGTVSVGTPLLEALAVPASQIPESLRAIEKEVTDRGPGPHILTGPVFIEEAEPGDVLEVRIRKIEADWPFAVNAILPGVGALPDDFPYTRLKLIPIDRARGLAHFADGIDIPMRPFFGSMGIAPPAGSGHISSLPPWIQGGNLDNKELVEGTTLYLPVHAKGALFEAGDGHAGQGNGEVDVTALETALTGTFQFVVRKDMHLNWPRAETPTHYITMGLHQDVAEAAKLAIREAIDFLVSEKHLTRDDAYMLASVAVDFDITQLVDGNKGVHAMIPKNIFTSRR